MDTEGSIRRLAFAEARSSGAEAMVGIAKHRNDLSAAAAQGKSEATAASQFADETRRLKAFDKTA